jgi:hypothetical protein
MNHYCAAVLANLWLFDLTRVIQKGNAICDIGAELIGEGLKVNSSLQKLSLVWLFCFC